MDRLIPALIVAGIVVLALSLMWWGWRGRAGRQSGLPGLQLVPADAGAEVLATRVLYVATTERGNPLERIAVGGLGFRAKARLGVREKGLELGIPGQDALFIPFTQIEAVFRASHAIDRAVERDGLVAVRFQLRSESGGGHATVVDSYFRIVDPSVATRFIDEVLARALNGVTR